MILWIAYNEYNSQENTIITNRKWSLESVMTNTESVEKGKSHTKYRMRRIA